MNKKDTYIEEIVELLEKVKLIHIEDWDKNLFGPDYNFAARDVVWLFLQLKERHGVDLNRLVPVVKEYTVNNLADALCILS